MSDLPFAFDLAPGGAIPSRYDRHTIRRLSDMRGQYADADAYDAALARENAALYEVYEMRRPPNPGDLAHGVSIVHPGVIGDEYFMTKGHYHAVLDTAEIYHCLGGRGAMVMETLEGGWAVEEMRAGRVVFVPPRWAHRTVNTGETDLAMLWAYPAHAGHDYGTIEARGFRKRIVARADGPRVIDNSRWCS